MLQICCQIDQDDFLICLCFIYLHVFLSCCAFAPVGHRRISSMQVEPCNSKVVTCSTQIIIPLLVALTNAKKTILLNWKSREKNISQWLDLLTQQISMKQQSALQKNQLEQFKTIYSSTLRAKKSACGSVYVGTERKN